MSVALPVSFSHAGCRINIKAQNSSTVYITINQKMSKVALLTNKIFGKIFSKKDVKSKRKVVPANSTNYSYVHKAIQGCKASRIYKFVVEKGACQTAFRVSYGSRNRSSIDLGDLAEKCR